MQGGSVQNSRATPRSQNQRKGAMIVLGSCDFVGGGRSSGFQLSRPLGAVITKRNRGPRPVRRGFGQLHGWLEVAEPAGWGLTDRRPTFQFAGGELDRYTLNRRRRHFAEINDPLADLSERDPYQPAATFPRPTRQCH